MKMYETTVAKEANRIINRHKARLLSNLEEANCPDVYIQSVASGLNWLRQDICELMNTNDNEKVLNDDKTDQ